MKRALWVSLLMFATACAPEETPDAGTVQPNTDEVAAVVSDCPDDGPRLALTNICAGRAHAYMNAIGETRMLPDNCHWVVQETQMPANEVLLYRAAKCGD